MTKTSAAEIIREYGPFPGVEEVAGVTFDGRHVWFASGDKLNALDPDSGEVVRSLDVAAHAGTAFRLAVAEAEDPLALARRDWIARRRRLARLFRRALRRLRGRFGGDQLAGRFASRR